MDRGSKSGERISSRLLRSASLGVLALSLTTAAAYAQGERTENVESVTVTGTLIKGINPIGTKAVTVDVGEIEATGHVTIGRILETVPQVSNIFNTVPVSGTNDVGTSRGVVPRIRNLNVSGGASISLLLINGHNVVGVGSLNTTSDLSQIPSQVVQRIDVVADGGSSLYGSDAVTGTINIITRKSYEGFETQGSYGTAAGGYDAYNFGAMGGHSWGSGNVYLAYQYTKNTYQMSSGRPYFGDNLIPLGGTVDNRSAPCALANVTAGGVTYALNSNTVANTPGALRAAATVGRNLCDTYKGGTPGSVGNAQGRAIIPAEQQSTLWLGMSQHIADGVEFSMTANASFHTARTLLPPRTTTNAVITNSNPFFQSINGETSQTVSFDYSPVFGPYNMGPQFENQWEIVPQLDIDLGTHGPFKDWSVNLLANYGRSDVDTINYAVNNAAVNSALATSDPAFALNPYNLGLSSKQSLASIQSYGQNGRGIQNIFQLRGLAQGEIFSLPGGGIHWAIGAQYEKYQMAGDYFNGNANGTIFPVGVTPEGGYRSTLSGHRITESIFAEIAAPIISPENDIPFVNSLEVDVSGRHDYLNTSGGGFQGVTDNYRIGVTYAPIDGLNIRGNSGTSFIAPSLSDTVAAIDTRVTFAGSAPVNPYDTPANQALERARPSIAMPGGNPNLKPQTSSTSSYGFDYHPSFIEGLTLSLTRWYVILQNTISLPGNQAASIVYAPGGDNASTGGAGVATAIQPYIVLNPTLAQMNALTTVNGVPVPTAGFSNGYAQFYNPNGAACPTVNAAIGCFKTTPYSFRDLRRFNFGKLRARGWDFGITYNTEFDWGTLDLGLNGVAYTLNRNITTIVTDQLAANLSPMQFTAFAGATVGPVGARITVQDSLGYTATGLGVQTRVSDFMVVNLNMGYELDGLFSWTENARISVTVNNAFDTNPPFANIGNGTLNGSTLGRMVVFELRKQF
jgi:iron complex outermembrane receptor protein